LGRITERVIAEKILKIGEILKDDGETSMPPFLERRSQLAKRESKERRDEKMSTKARLYLFVLMYLAFMYVAIIFPLSNGFLK